MLVVDYDEASGIVVTKAAGLSSTDEFDGYLPALATLLDRSAARHGRWLHLVDVSESSVQSQGSMDHIAAVWNEKPRSEGYSAYVVGSMLGKLQIRRLNDHPAMRFFDDDRTATAWLLDCVANRRSAAAR